MSEEDFQKFASFPPFYTLQPNPETRQKQLDLWARLLLDYFQKEKKTFLSVKALLDPTFSLLNNTSLDRAVNRELLMAILDELHRRGNITWRDKAHSEATIAWKSPAEWASVIQKWLQETGQGSSVLTLYELVAGCETEDQPFHGLDRDIVLQALRHMESKRLAEIMNDGEGVKFMLV